MADDSAGSATQSQPPPTTRFGMLLSILTATAQVRQWERIAVWFAFFYVLSVCILHVPLPSLPTVSGHP